RVRDEQPALAHEHGRRTRVLHAPYRDAPRLAQRRHQVARHTGSTRGVFAQGAVTAAHFATRRLPHLSFGASFGGRRPWSQLRASFASFGLPHCRKQPAAFVASSRPLSAPRRASSVPGSPWPTRYGQASAATSWSPRFAAETSARLPRASFCFTRPAAATSRTSWKRSRRAATSTRTTAGPPSLPSAAATASRCHFEALR